jgi:hypothetical protein
VTKPEKGGSVAGTVMQAEEGRVEWPRSCASPGGWSAWPKTWDPAVERPGSPSPASAMRQVSGSFLMNIAEISATLIGVLIVGVFFYVETGLRRLKEARKVAEPYLRSATRVVLVLYAIPLAVSLSLVALEIGWAMVIFALLSLILVITTVDSSIRIWPIARVLRSRALLVNDLVSSLWVLILVAIPWVLGGLDPTREELTWALLLALASGFLSTCTLLLSVFDIARFEAAAREGGSGGS